MVEEKERRLQRHETNHNDTIYTALLISTLNGNFTRVKRQENVLVVKQKAVCGISHKVNIVY